MLLILGLLIQELLHRPVKSRNQLFKPVEFLLQIPGYQTHLKMLQNHLCRLGLFLRLILPQTALRYSPELSLQKLRD